MRFEQIEHDGRARLRLTADDGASAEVSLHGAHVTSWQPAPGRERLYLSANANFAAGTAIRGGIPVVFPQFAGRGPMIKHGFARLLDWRHIDSPDARTAMFELRDGPATNAHWPARFSARLGVALSPATLEVSLEIVNEGDAPWDFTAALHTYLRVSGLAGVSLCGLEGAPYFDSANSGSRAPGDGNAVRFSGELDRIYPDAAGPLLLRDANLPPLELTARAFRDTVVWNPGAVLAASIADLGASEHERFICAESATVIEPVTLAPGERWRGTQRLRELPSN